MVVQKYGGSSVATIEKIKDIANHIKKIYEKDKEIVVVVSAMGKTTNMLIEKAKQITKNPDRRELDRLLSIGENETIALLSIALNSIGVKTRSYTGEQLNILTNGVHTKSRIESIDTNKILENFKNNIVSIVAGFQGIDKNLDVTTLGRGGSDTTAVALAACLGCPCEIYTDVDGIYSIDPRVYSKAKKIDTISYEEMMELAYQGAKIMEPRAIELACKYKVPIYVGLSLSEKTGSMIESKEHNTMEKQKIKGISINENILMVTLDKIATYAYNLEPIFTKAKELGINIDMISHNDVISEYGSIAFTSPLTDEQLLEELFSNLNLKEETEYIINKNVVKISLVGIGIMTNISIIANIFEVLAKNNISFHQISTSELSISIIVDKSMGKIVAALLADKFEI